MSHFIYIGNDNLLTVTELQCNAAGSLGYANVASCYVTLVESGTANEIANQSWPLALALVSSETGTWQTTLQDTLTMSEGMAVEALVTLDAAALGKKYVRFPLTAVHDKG
jgi:hypothetical protein